MRINVQSCNATRRDDRFVQQIAKAVEGNLSRFESRIRNVDVLIINENESRVDKRCLIEARLADRGPIAVRAHARTYERAVNVAAEKIGSTIDELDHRTVADEKLPG